MELGLTVGDSIDRTERTIDGFDFAELSVGEGTDTDAIDRERLETVLDDAGADLCVHLPFKQVVATSVPEINDAILSYLTRLLEWAGSVDARKAVLHGTARNPHDTDLRPIFADQLEAIDAAAETEDVELVVENVGHQKRGLPLSVLGDLAAETDTAVCFDVGHAYMEDGNDGVDRFLSGYGDLVSHLHVHDARSRGDTHIPIGAGEIDYDIVTDHLAGFDGTVAIEVFTDDLELLCDTGERARAALETEDSS
ncbi:sugar phosphate isomerase/epimerase family protein [Natronobacterium texcoconense]|uniref:Sugar phosphate isomerase/epimerase n=1 Tax=Natronobacterium texcoconense TaxID=1095778 RepID=A0A1H1AZ96_NATTX|nr:sugar phosphate isomerase/epimerase [Natronobacterium texcoconense]SDQ44999.1 Sugar phosphate isomerase/epimerase [Natronobacterium texcoconense]